MTNCCNHNHPAPTDNDDAQSGTCKTGIEKTSDGSSESISIVEPTKSKKLSDEIQTSIRIRQMDCPTEEALIRKKLDGIDAVKRVDFNLMQRVLTVVHAPDSLEQIVQAIRSLGFDPELPNVKTDMVTNPPETSWWPLALASVAALASETINWIGQSTWLAAALGMIAVASCGLTTYRKGWTAIRNGNLNINALMSIAVTGAMALGQWPEAAMVMVLFTVAELIEAKSLDRARNVIKGLIDLTPEMATVQLADGSWSEMEAKKVEVGSLVRVRPGERIGLDGEIVRGSSSVNQAPITGESLLVEKAQGDSVFAGTINESGSFEYRVTAAANNTTLARIIHAVEDAQGAKAPTQRFVDQFARVYTPVVFTIALGVAVLPPLLLNGLWHDWIYKALVLLVIACPCALVISTPVTIVSGLAAAARRGILIKGGIYLEKGRKLRWLALDKTGTITHGKPRQTDFELLASNDAEHCKRVAVSLADRSDHPVSKALVQAAGRVATLDSVSDFEALAGRGVRGVIQGKSYWLGNHRLLRESELSSTRVETPIAELERQGKTVVLLFDKQAILALFAVADTVKPSSRDAIKELDVLGIKTVMLSGDNSYTVESIANEVGINQARGNLLPQDKLAEIEKFSTEAMVGMVGDGINDAPALARADIGFAMGAMGTDTAIETADVALMDDDLRKIPEFVRLSRATHSLLIQNISLAIGIKVVFLALTLLGLGTMWMAVFADVGASLLVVGNGLRILRK